MPLDIGGIATISRLLNIIRLKPYRRAIKRLKASAADVTRMENAVADDPLSGELVVGLGGVRKARFRIGNRGKSGGGRVVYYAALAVDRIYLITCYAKGDQEDLTPDDRREVNALATTLAAEVRRELMEDESGDPYGEEDEPRSRS